MSTSRSSAMAKPSGGGSTSSTEKSLFEQQREVLVSEIAASLEHVLQNLNRLNRNLESITAVGNEFSTVEALWSQFEGVMAKNSEGPEVDKEMPERRDDDDDAGEDEVGSEGHTESKTATKT